MNPIVCPTCGSGLWIGKPLARLCLACGTRTAAAGGKAARDGRARAKRSPEQVQAATQRDYLRRQARAEAVETGRPVEEIYAAWGVA